MPNRTKRATELVERGAKSAKKGAERMKDSALGKLAMEGARAAGRTYSRLKSKIATAKRKRAVRKVARTTMGVAREAGKAAIVAGAVTAALATAREIRKRSR